jgi:hypothetical protein
VLVAGNHDQSIEAWGIPDGLRCHYLIDEGTEGTEVVNASLVDDDYRAVNPVVEIVV